LSIGSLHIRFSTTDHGPPTRAMRFDDPAGPALAYSADTGPGWSVGSFGPGIGTFLCEATHLRDGEGHSQHLSGRQAGAMAREAGVDRLIITHRSPTVSAGAVVDEATAAFGRPVEQAAVGAAFDW
jgi:ribonuclease BN (tRNA processing enzyme)